MRLKNILLFMFLVIAGSGLYGQKRSNNNLLITESRDDNILTGAALGHVSEGVQPMDTIYGIDFAQGGLPF